MTRGGGCRVLVESSVLQDASTLDPDHREAP
jgi:hypothetical protein